MDVVQGILRYLKSTPRKGFLFKKNKLKTLWNFDYFTMTQNQNSKRINHLKNHYCPSPTQS